MSSCVYFRSISVSAGYHLLHEMCNTIKTWGRCFDETLYFLAQNNKMIRKMERLILRGSTTSRHICSLETVSFSTENSKKSSSKWSQMGAVTALKLLAWHKFKIKKLEVKMKLVLTVPFGLHPESFAWYLSHFVFQVNFFLRQLIL